MALRVLLADESTTIKKVMQLALQDFAVEVKSVQSGVDVVEVAKAFQPDIIFADVLLQKKNGYEVSAELKKNPVLKEIPVVLMWSSFMDLDERQAQASQCNQRLEKPFDVEHLRQIVLELVPKTRSQRLAHFLKFPDSVTEPLKGELKARTQAPPPPMSAAPPKPPIPPPRTPPPVSAAIPMPPPPMRSSRAPDDDDMEMADLESLGAPPSVPKEEKSPAKSSWNMESFDEIGNFEPLTSVPSQSDEDEAEEFQEIRMTAAPKQPVETDDDDEENEARAPRRESLSLEDRDPWSHQDLARFKLDLPAIDAEELEVESRNDAHEPFSTEHDSGLQRGEFLLQRNIESQPAQTIELEDYDDVPRGPAPELEIEETIPSEELALSDPPSRMHASEELSMSGGSVPQLSPDRLEQIIRSQSREIIEAVVRRIVPDLATDIIRAELHRLLSEEKPR